MEKEKAAAVNVQVLLRCRPFSSEEIRNNAPQVVTCNDFQREVAVTQTIAGKQFDRVFTFDKVFGPTAKQKDLYDQAIIPIVNEVLEGFNCTIFAYGQTGTGKTYTMEGECRRAKSGPKGQLPADAGVIPRAVKQIFDTLERQGTEYSVKVTFLELYNEEITDLLAPEEISKAALEDRQKKNLPLMEDGKGGVLIRGLEEEVVTNADEIFSLLERGSAKRRTAETLLNKQSSRSHSLFSITIHMKEATPEGEELIKCGKLNLVDLAGSENVSRSGAREGRAREVGEINKSLLTLGRVITALVEHLGHVPYRDSKLTRLLRDSLGGRTKTCIIATVSPSVHCLEETMSTLDYAHRAKSIKNRPEVNQKMMKSTLIKDLYGEIDRLKAEVCAAREKVGVYIPEERYQLEENERKTMAEQIEKMTASLEADQKQINELQRKYNSELQHSAELSNLLSTTKEDLKQAQYNLTVKDCIISEQKKAENALTHEACVLKSDLDKFSHDQGEKLSATNRSVVNSFQTDLASKLDILSSTLNSSIDQQNKHLKSVEDLCQSFVDSLDKATSELKKILASKSLYMSHMEAFQNVVLLHKSNTNATLDDMSSLSAASCCSLDQLACVEGEAQNIISDIQKLLTAHRSEITHFTQELRESFRISLARTKEMSTYIEETSKLHSHSSNTHEAQMKSINDFQKAYMEQSKSEEQKLLADISSLVSKHMTRQRELVDVRLSSLDDAARGSKAFLDEHTSAMDCVTKDAKRKCEAFADQAEKDCTVGSSFSAAKHCRKETMVQECACTVDSTVEQWEKSHAAVNDLSKKHVAEVEALFSPIECTEQHKADIASSRALAEEHASDSSKDITQDIESTHISNMGDTISFASYSDEAVTVECDSRSLFASQLEGTQRAKLEGEYKRALDKKKGHKTTWVREELQLLRELFVARGQLLPNTCVANWIKNPVVDDLALELFARTQKAYSNDQLFNKWKHMKADGKFQLPFTVTPTGIEIDTGQPPIVFKSHLYKVTHVPPERQKIIGNCGIFKDDVDWSTLGVKDGQKLVMIDTADEILIFRQDQVDKLVKFRWAKVGGGKG